VLADAAPADAVEEPKIEGAPETGALSEGE
jgi:hypothetical protein